MWSCAGVTVLRCSLALHYVSIAICPCSIASNSCRIISQRLRNRLVLAFRLPLALPIASNSCCNESFGRLTGKW